MVAAQMGRAAAPVASTSGRHALPSSQQRHLPMPSQRARHVRRRQQQPGTRRTAGMVVKAAGQSSNGSISIPPPRPPYIPNRCVSRSKRQIDATGNYGRYLWTRKVWRCGCLCARISYCTERTCKSSQPSGIASKPSRLLSTSLPPRDACCDSLLKYQSQSSLLHPVSVRIDALTAVSTVLN